MVLKKYLTLGIGTLLLTSQALAKVPHSEIKYKIENRTKTGVGLILGGMVSIGAASYITSLNERYSNLKVFPFHNKSVEFAWAGFAAILWGTERLLVSRPQIEIKESRKFLLEFKAEIIALAKIGKAMPRHESQVLVKLFECKDCSSDMQRGQIILNMINVLEAKATVLAQSNFSEQFTKDELEKVISSPNFTLGAIDALGEHVTEENVKFAKEFYRIILFNQIMKVQGK